MVFVIKELKELVYVIVMLDGLKVQQEKMKELVHVMLVPKIILAQLVKVNNYYFSKNKKQNLSQHQKS